MNKPLFSFTLSLVLTITSFQAFAVNTYTYKVKGQGDDVTLSHTYDAEGWFGTGEASYTFSSYGHYGFLMRNAQAPYNCECNDGCGCTSYCPIPKIHSEDCPAFGILAGTFLVRYPKNKGAPPSEEDRTKSIRPMVIPLRQLILPLMAHFNSRQQDSQPPSSDVLDNTLLRLQAASFLSTTTPLRGFEQSNNENDFMDPRSRPDSPSPPHDEPMSSCDSTNGITVLIPPAALANNPDAPVPDILPLALITDPVFIFNEQGAREAIEFNARFLHISGASYWASENNTEASSRITTPGRYRINLATGEFHLIVTVEGRPPVEITGSIVPTNEPEPVHTETAGLGILGAAALAYGAKGRSE